MLSNVGGKDRTIRILGGLVLLGLGFAHVVTGTMAIIVYAIGAIALVTGLVRFCPAWSLFGINTRAAASRGK